LYRFEFKSLTIKWKFKGNILKLRTCIFFLLWWRDLRLQKKKKNEITHDKTSGCVLLVLYILSIPAFPIWMSNI